MKKTVLIRYIDSRKLLLILNITRDITILSCTKKTLTQINQFHSYFHGFFDNYVSESMQINERYIPSVRKC